MPSPRLFCFGLGYSAMALARRLQPRGWRIAGTCRTAEAAAALRNEGIDAMLFDRDRPPTRPEADLAGASHILSSVAPDETGDPVLECWGAALARLPDVAWVGYLSTTGVYGDRAGGWV